MKGLLYNPLFAGSMGLLAAGGPSRFPVGFGQALNQGLLSAQNADVTGTKLGLAKREADQQDQLFALKQQAIADERAQREQQAAALQRFQGLLSPEQQAMVSAGVPIGDVAKAAGLLGVDPEKPMNVAPGGALVDPRTGDVLYQAPFKPDAPTPSSFQLVQTADGGYVGIDPKDPTRVIPVPGVLGKPPSGMSVTVGPDGGIQLVQGPGAGNLTTKNATDVQKNVIDSAAELGKVRGILAQFKPEYHTLPEELRQGITSFKARAGLGVGEGDRKKLEAFARYKADAGRMQAEQINALYGAALTENESKRAEKFIVAENDDPITAEQKLKSYEDLMRNAMARNAYIARNGIASINAVPLQAMPTIIQQRGDELAAQFKEQGVPESSLPAKVRDQLVIEFGLVQ